MVKYNKKIIKEKIKKVNFSTYDILINNIN